MQLWLVPCTHLNRLPLAGEALAKRSGRESYVYCGDRCVFFGEGRQQRRSERSNITCLALVVGGCASLPSACCRRVFDRDHT